MTKTTRYISLAVILSPFAIFTMLIIWALATGPDARNYTQVSYFKSENRNHVFVLCAKDHVTAETAKLKLEYHFHTERQMTVSYLFNEDCPQVDDVTLAPTFQEAMRRVPPHWAFKHVIYPTGKVVFIDAAS